MSEMTTSEIVKIVVGVLIFVIVIFGVYVSFRNYIIPYFGGFNHQGEQDLASPYYQSLMIPENQVATLDNLNFIIFTKSSNGNGASYYFSKDRSTIFTGDKTSFSRLVRLVKYVDPKVGKINEQGKIEIDPNYLARDSRLISIDGGELVVNEIYKFSSKT